MIIIIIIAWVLSILLLARKWIIKLAVTPNVLIANSDSCKVVMKVWYCYYSFSSEYRWRTVETELPFTELDMFLLKVYRKSDKKKLNTKFFRKHPDLLEELHDKGITSMYLNGRGIEFKDDDKDSPESGSSYTDDPYKVLGVLRSSSFEVISRRYKDLMKISHPDTHAELDPEYSSILNCAYEKIKRDYGRR